MGKAIIINQSQQMGVEWELTKPIAESLQNTLIKNNVPCYLVPCYRADDLKSIDATLLVNSVYQANQYYKRLIQLGFKHTDIAQIDIHCNANNGKSWGCSMYYISTEGARFARELQKEISAVTPWNDNLGIEYHPSYYTLKNSNAINVIAEMSFYDESTQLTFIRKNPDVFALAMFKAICNYFKLNTSPPPDIEFETAVKKLSEEGIIKSKDEWGVKDSYNGTYVRQLIKNMGSYIVSQK